MAARKAAKPRARATAKKAAPKARAAPPKPNKAAEQTGAAPTTAGRTRVVIPMSFYATNKDAVKAPFKKLGMKWGFLGQDADTTRGRYVGKNVGAYVEYTAQNADFTLSGSDTKAIDQILAAWAEFPTVAEASAPPPSPEEGALARELAVWAFGKPVRRAGEPDSFFRLRTRDWEQQDPRTRRAPEAS